MKKNVSSLLNSRQLRGPLCDPNINEDELTQLFDDFECFKQYEIVLNDLLEGDDQLGEFIRNEFFQMINEIVK